MDNSITDTQATFTSHHDASPQGHGAFVHDLCDFASHAKSVGDAGRDVNLLEVFGREPDADQLPKARRASPNVDCHVVDLAFDHANQFSLRPSNLRMQTADL